MISVKKHTDQSKAVLKYFHDAGIAVTEDEKKRIEVADFGLNKIDTVGLQLLTYINTERVCAKEMVLFPFQTCPEHTHPDTAGGCGAKIPGKEETFRCRRGKVFLYVGGAKTDFHGVEPDTLVTVRHEIILLAGEQYTIYPNTLHWFQAGPEGAVISEFSTRSCDESDIFTDKNVDRSPRTED